MIMIYDSNNWINVKIEKFLSKSVQKALINIKNEFEMMKLHVVSNADYHVFLKYSQTFNAIIKFELVN